MAADAHCTSAVQQPKGMCARGERSGWAAAQCAEIERFERVGGGARRSLRESTSGVRRSASSSATVDAHLRAVCASPLDSPVLQQRGGRTSAGKHLTQIARWICLALAADRVHL